MSLMALPRKSMPSIGAWLGAACMLAVSQLTWAGRPLTTEDAGVNAKAFCQIEAWIDHTSDVRHGHMAPACGLLDGLELGLEWDSPAPASVAPHGIAASLKWAPDMLAWNGWRFGAKLGGISEKGHIEADRHFSRWTALGIATYEVTERWTAHVNVGHTRDKLGQNSAIVYGGALVYALNDRTQLFGEWNGDSSMPATRTAGMRWWLFPETLGLDLTTSQGNASPNGRAWGVGLGWYGLHF